MTTTLDALTSLSIQLAIKGQATKNIAGNINPNDSSITDTPKFPTFIIGTAPPGQLNEIVSQVITVGNGATSNLTLNGSAFTDMVGQASATLTKVILLKVHLLSTKDSTDFAGSGTTASGITIGAAAGTPWTGILNSTGTITLPNGAFFFFYAPNGVAVGGTDILKIVNNDGATAAKVLITVLGVG